MNSIDKKMALDYIMTTANKKGISQSRLIEGIYDYSHFNRMCNGKEAINLEILLMCASKLGISISELISLKKGDGDTVHEIKELYQEYLLLQQYDELALLLERLQTLGEKSWFCDQLDYTIQGVLQAEVHKDYKKAMDCFKKAFFCTCKVARLDKIDFTYLSKDELDLYNSIAMCSYYLGAVAKVE